METLPIELLHLIFAKCDHPAVPATLFHVSRALRGAYVEYVRGLPALPAHLPPGRCICMRGARPAPRRGPSALPKGDLAGFLCCGGCAEEVVTAWGHESCLERVPPAHACHVLRYGRPRLLGRVPRPTPQELRIAVLYCKPRLALRLAAAGQGDGLREFAAAMGRESFLRQSTQGWSCGGVDPILRGELPCTPRTFELLKEHGYKFGGHEYRSAFESRNTEAVVSLTRAGILPSGSDMAAAVEFGQIPLVEEMIAAGGVIPNWLVRPPSLEMAHFLAKHGYLPPMLDLSIPPEILRVFIKAGAALHPFVVETAATTGASDVLEAMGEAGLRFDVDWLCRAAAGTFPCKPDAFRVACKYAGPWLGGEFRELCRRLPHHRAGQDIVEAMGRTGYPWDGSEPRRAAEAGSAALLAALRAAGRPFAGGELCAAIAAGRHNLRALHVAGCGWDGRETEAAAAAGNHAAIEALHELGRPWTGQELQQADHRRTRKLLRRLGCKEEGRD